MQLICPYCKSQQEHVATCSQCQQEIGWIVGLYIKSEYYYVKAYECAQKRELSQAIKYLEKVLFFNKDHFQGRNLLGLTYYELGNMGEALKAWQVSQNVQREDNLATIYLTNLKKEKRKYEHYKEANILYNRSLTHLRKNSIDVAMINLKKAVQLNPQFVEARNLLALAYIMSGKYSRAKTQIERILKIDKGNVKALRYLIEIQSKTSGLDHSSEPTSLERKDMVSQGKVAYIQPQKVINRGHILRTAVLYFIIGAACMLGVQVALVMPNQTAAIQVEMDQLEESNQTLQKQLEKVRVESTSQILALEEEISRQKTNNDQLQNKSNKLVQQQKLSKAKEYAGNREWVAAADELYNISVQELEEDQKIEFEQLKETVLPKASDLLYNEGYQFYSKGNYIEAKSVFEKLVLYTPQHRNAAKALYYMGEIEEKNGNIEKAKQYYESVIQDFKGQSVYNMAQNKLKTLNK